MNEGSASPTPCRLVTFLGTGNYQPARYQWLDLPPVETAWTVEALCRLVEPRPTDVRVLTTDKAREKNGAGIQGALRECGAPLQFIAFPDGAGERVLWEQFDLLKRQLRAPSATPVILDVTHGFRSFHFFAAAVVAFLRSVDRDPPALRVVYGAFDARDANGGIAPIWDLTPFVDLLDWTREIMLFLKTGRVGGVSHLLKGTPELDMLGSALERFGLDIETIRTGSLVLGSGDEPSSAQLLQKCIDEARASITAKVPPLADVLQRLEQRIEGLIIDPQPLNTPAAHRALGELVGWYLDMGRYVEAATTVREGWQNLYADDPAATPGDPGCTVYARDIIAGGRWRRADRKFHKASAIRNDIDHAGYRFEARTAAKLIEDVNGLVRDFRQAKRKTVVRPLPLLLNITNHPSADWGAAQREAAQAMAAAIEDLPFPDVPPDADEAKIAEIANELTGRVPKATTHALVQGEWSLTVALIDRLERQGIVCLAATTRRDAVAAADGTKTSRFAFVRFRRYRADSS